MAKEDTVLEDILKQTEAPKRVNGKEKPKTKIAKLTRRTIESLKGKIKNGKLSYSFWRYNSNYKKMISDLKEAKEVLQKQVAGEKVSDAKVETAFEIVASHNKRLAKHGARLLEYDIKEIAQQEKAKKIKIPSWVRGKFRTITRTVLDATFQKVKDRKVQKKTEKDLKDTTRAYINNSVEGAFFKGGIEGELRENINVDTLKNLTPDKNAKTIEDKMASLRRFISADGKSPLLSEEEIGAKEKIGTDVPPVAPEATVAKEDKKVTTDQLLSGIAKKDSNEEKLEKETETPLVETTAEKKESAPVKRVTVDDIMKNLGHASTPVVVNVEETSHEEIKEPVEEKQPEVEEVDEHSNARKQEIATIVALGKSRDVLYEQLSQTKDIEVANALREYIEAIDIEIKEIASSGLVTERNKKAVESREKIEAKENENDKAVKVAKPLVDSTIEYEYIELPNARVREEHESIDPIEVNPKKEEKTTSMSNVRFTEPSLTRVAQSSEPSVLRVTPEDIKKLEERNADLERRISILTKEKEELLAQKSLYEKAIELGKEADAKMSAVEQLTEDTAGLKGEVNDLGAQAAPYISRLGK